MKQVYTTINAVFSGLNVASFDLKNYPLVFLRMYYAGIYRKRAYFLLYIYGPFFQHVFPDINIGHI